MESDIMIINNGFHRRWTYRGFTLTEAMIAMVILGIAAAGVLLPFTGGARARAEGMHRTLAAKLASDLMEQILVTPYENIVDSYNGYSESQGQVKDATGTVFTDLSYANFSRDASCAYVYVSPQSGSVEPNFILITVRVYYSGSRIVTLNRLICE